MLPGGTGNTGRTALTQPITKATASGCTPDEPSMTSHPAWPHHYLHSPPSLHSLRRQHSPLSLRNPKNSRRYINQDFRQSWQHSLNSLRLSPISPQLGATRDQSPRKAWGLISQDRAFQAIFTAWEQNSEPYDKLHQGYSILVEGEPFFAPRTMRNAKGAPMFGYIDDNNHLCCAEPCGTQPICPNRSLCGAPLRNNRHLSRHLCSRCHERERHGLPAGPIA